MPLENGKGAQQMTNQKTGSQSYNHKTRILPTTQTNEDMGLALQPPKRSQLLYVHQGGL